MAILREAVAVHMEDMRSRSISIGVPDNVVILARLKDGVIGKHIAVETVEGGAAAPCRRQEIGELRPPDGSVAITGISVDEIRELLRTARASLDALTRATVVR
jgi:hypothetical protein